MPGCSLQLQALAACMDAWMGPLKGSRGGAGLGDTWSVWDHGGELLQGGWRGVGTCKWGVGSWAAWMVLGASWQLPRAGGSPWGVGPTPWSCGQLPHGMGAVCTVCGCNLGAVGCLGQLGMQGGGVGSCPGVHGSWGCQLPVASTFTSWCLEHQWAPFPLQMPAAHIHFATFQLTPHFKTAQPVMQQPPALNLALGSNYAGGHGLGAASMQPAGLPHWCPRLLSHSKKEMSAVWCQGGLQIPGGAHASMHTGAGHATMQLAHPCNPPQGCGCCPKFALRVW